MMNANNQAEQDWRIFRRYKFSEVTITESGDHIQFSQRAAPDHDRVGKLYVAVALMWLIPVVGLFLTPYWVAGAVYGVASLLPLLAVFGVGYAFLYGKTYVDIRPTDLTVKNQRQHMTVTFDQIRNIDVQQEGSWSTVVIWHGPVALQTMTTQSYQNAVSIKEGMVAAIGMLSARAAVPPEPARRSFQE
jgi:hypothetical protein